MWFWNIVHIPFSEMSQRAVAKQPNIRYTKSVSDLKFGSFVEMLSKANQSALSPSPKTGGHQQEHTRLLGTFHFMTSASHAGMFGYLGSKITLGAK